MATAQPAGDLLACLAGDWRGLMLLGTADETGVLQLLGHGAQAEEQLDAPQVASRLGLAEGPTVLFLEALADKGILLRAGGGFHLAPVLQACWAADQDPGAPDSVRLLTTPGSDYYRFYHLLHRYRGQARWVQLPQVLRAGAPPAQSAAGSRDLRHFVCGMGNCSPQVLARTVQACLQACPEGRRVLDLGGGPGFMAREFARAGCQVVLQDQPGVLELNRRQGRVWPGVTFFPGDFLQVLPEGPFDLIYLGNITHIYGGEEVAHLLRRLWEHQAPSGAVVIHDHLGGRSPEARLYALQMHLSPHQGAVWSEAEYRSWLEQAGYQEVRLLYGPEGTKPLVTGRRAK